MTQEEKARRYDEALERARKCLDEKRDTCFVRPDVIFPELKEGEDERISREITEFILTHRIDEPNDIEDTNSWLAWLEKKGESKLAGCEDDRIRKWLVDTTKQIPDSSIEWETISKSDVLAWLENQGKQKPAKWSEEDELIALSIEHVMNCASLLNIVPDKIDKIRTWLKSLKDRYTWKPSDEQMAALSNINVTGGVSYAGQGQELINLYNDLKKLMKDNYDKNV